MVACGACGACGKYHNSDGSKRTHVWNGKKWYSRNCSEDLSQSWWQHVGLRGMWKISPSWWCFVNVCAGMVGNEMFAMESEDLSKSWWQPVENSHNPDGGVWTCLPERLEIRLSLVSSWNDTVAMESEDLLQSWWRHVDHVENLTILMVVCGLVCRNGRT